MTWSDGSIANPRTDASVTNNLTVTASFAINTYTLTYSSGSTNSTLSGSSPQLVNYGASGTAVTPLPNTGYHFVNWSDGSTASPRTDASVTNDVTVTATFVAVISAPPVITNAAMALNGTAFTLAGTGVANQDYVLLTATNLPPANWLPVQTNTADASGAFQFTDPWATNGQQFYRIQAKP